MSNLYGHRMWWRVIDPRDRGNRGWTRLMRRCQRRREERGWRRDQP